MACYWGCSTKGNRVAWSLMSALFAIGTSLIIAGVIGNFAGKGSKNCLKVYTNCANGNNEDLFIGSIWNPTNITIADSKQECFNLADHQCDLKLWGALFLAGSGVLVICLSFTFFFCCCARRPSHSVGEMSAAPVAKAARGQAPQGAMYYPANIPATSVPAPQEAYGPARV